MKKFTLLFVLALTMGIFTFSVAAENIVKDPIVFTYHSAEERAANAKSENDCNGTIENGYFKITNATIDPNFFLPVEDMEINAAEYKYFKCRIKCLDNIGANMMGQIFFATDKSGDMGVPGTFTNYTFVPKDDFIEITLNLESISGYRGILKKFRFDPYVGTDDIPTTSMLIDYIAFFTTEEEMKKYPQTLTQDEINTIEKENAPIVLEVKRETPENFVFNFNSFFDFENFATITNQLEYEFQEGVIKITNVSTDPYMLHRLSEKEYFYADDLPFLKIRIKPLSDSGKKEMAQFFFKTDKIESMGVPGSYKNIDFIANNEWQEIIIDLKNDIASSQWSSVIAEIRFDTVVASADQILPMLVDYVALFPTRDAAEAYENTNAFPNSESDTTIFHSGIQNVIIPAKTVKSGETFNEYLLKNTDAQNPEKVIGGPVVAYTDKDGNSKIVPLSFTDRGITTYVARQGGNYSLTYNSKKYSDISGHWGYPTIMFASNRKLFGGTTETNFSPDMTMTRGMFITVLGRMHGLDESVYSADTGYTDVNSAEYYAPYISWAKELGLAKGSTVENTFSPEQPITRSDMALIISNYIKKYNYILRSADENSAFSDISALESDTKNAITQIQSIGIINGKSDGVFDPAGISTRAEVATVMSRLIKAILDVDLTFYETYETSMEFKTTDPNRLRFGAYVPHPSDMKTLDEKQIRELAQAGIDFSIIGYDSFNYMPERFKKNVYHWYERYGIECINMDFNVTKLASDQETVILDESKMDKMFYKDMTAFGGISLADEPGTDMFPALGESVKKFNEEFPDKIAFINLLPMYANSAQLKGGAGKAEVKYYESVETDYKKYLDDYVKYVPTSYICADIYPGYANKQTYKDYAKSIEMVADACRESGRDFWIVVQSCSWGSGIRVPDREDMYWQTYTMLSFGAKNIMYYIFAYRDGHNGTPIDKDGNKTPLWYDIEAVHNEIRKFDDIYMQYNNLGVFNHNSSSKTSYLELSNPYKNFDTISEIKCDKPLLIGCFEKDDKTSKAFTVVNYNNLATPAAADVSLKIVGNKVTAYIGGNPTVLTQDKDGYYNFTLESGMGVFVTVE